MDFSLITALWAFWSRRELQEKPYNCAKNLSSVVSYSRVALPASSEGTGFPFPRTLQQ
jgi:hypothetical protein